MSVTGSIPTPLRKLSAGADQVEVEGATIGEVLAAAEEAASAKDAWSGLAGFLERALELQVGKISGRRVHATYSTDPALLGGAVVKIGSTIYDGSVKGQLEKLRQELSS